MDEYRLRTPQHTGMDQEEHVLNESLALLPAWAFERLLSRAWRSRGGDDTNVLKGAFPPGTPLVDMWSSFPAYKHLTIQEALKLVFAGWRRSVLGQDGSDNVPHPRFRRFESSPHKRQVAYLTASLAYEDGSGTRIAVHVTIDRPFGEDTDQSVIQLTSHADHRERTIRKICEIESYAEEHNHLRGHKLDAKGRFILLEQVYEWDCIYADPKLLATIRRNTQGFLDRLDQYRKFHLPTRRGVLLHGKPGTGKTLIGKVLCCQLQQTFIWVRPGNVSNTGRVTSVFEMARDISPSLLFFEDLDLFGSTRTHRSYSDMLLGELLNQLDGLRENDGIVVVATTNDLEAIEPALKDRPSRQSLTRRAPGVSIHTLVS